MLVSVILVEFSHLGDNNRYLFECVVLVNGVELFYALRIRVLFFIVLPHEMIVTVGNVQEFVILVFELRIHLPDVCNCIPF